MLSAQKADDMVECPYNKVHRMLRKRLQQHLLKCRLSYPDVELQKCPFNQTHLVPEPEYVHHVTNCSDRKLITQYKYDCPITEPEVESVKQEVIQCEDNWDDTEVEDYNPQKYVAQAKVLRKLDGGLKTQRKEFIKQERKRLGDYDSEDEKAEKAKLNKLDMDRPASSDEDADYVYSAGRPMTPPPPSNVAWFEDKKGRNENEDKLREVEERRALRIEKKDRHSSKRSRSRSSDERRSQSRSRRSNSRFRDERNEPGSSSRRGMHTEMQNKEIDYALDEDPYYCGAANDFRIGNHEDICYPSPLLYGRAAHSGQRRTHD